MAQRTGWAATEVMSLLAMLSALSTSREAKEQQAIPAGAGGLTSDGTQRAVTLACVFESILQDFDGDGFAAIPATQYRARDRQAPILAFDVGNALPVNPGCGHLRPEIGIIGDGQRALPGAL